MNIVKQKDDKGSATGTATHSDMAVGRMFYEDQANNIEQDKGSIAGLERKL